MRVSRTHAQSRAIKAAHAAEMAQLREDRAKLKAQNAKWAAFNRARIAENKAAREAAGPKYVAAYAKKCEENRIRNAKKRAQQKIEKENKRLANERLEIERLAWIKAGRPTDLDFEEWRRQQGFLT